MDPICDVCRRMWTVNGTHRVHQDALGTAAVAMLVYTTAVHVAADVVLYSQ